MPSTGIHVTSIQPKFYHGSNRTVTSTVSAIAAGTISGVITSIGINAGGINFVVGDVLTIPGGDSAGRAVVQAVTTVGASVGVISALSLTVTGTTYATTTGAALTGGTGSGAKVDILAVSGLLIESANGILLVADQANTLPVFIGSSIGVTAGSAAATDGVPLYAGAALLVPVASPSLIFGITSSAANQVVYWMGA